MHNLHTPKVCTPKGLGSWAIEEGAELWWREGLPEGLLQRPLMEPSPVLHVSAPWGGVVPQGLLSGHSFLCCQDHSPSPGNETAALALPLGGSSPQGLHATAPETLLCSDQRHNSPHPGFFWSHWPTYLTHLTLQGRPPLPSPGQVRGLFMTEPPATITDG